MTIAAHASMAAATSLVRAGKPGEATELIRALLAGNPPIARSSAPAEGVVLDLVPDRVTHAPVARAPSPAPTETPRVEGAFLARRHVGPAGSLAYKLYAPAGAGEAMPLVVMLHGCTQSPDDFALGAGMNALADEFGLIVAYPAQSQAANAHKCWNWFRPGDQRRDRGEPALIAAVTREIIAERGIDPARVYIAGLSAGGAAAAVMGDAYPDLYAAVGIHSGLACGAARDLPSALMAMKNGGTAAAGPRARFTPVITFHGDRDATVHEANSRAIIAMASAAAGGGLTTRVDTGLAAGGRRYTRAVARDDRGLAMIEQWTVHGAGHAWSGGDSRGSYTDPAGPDASREMVRFFLQHRLRDAAETSLSH